MDVNWSEIPIDRLQKMQDAGGIVAECHRVLAKTGHNIVGEILKGSDGFFLMNHYPDGDVYDHDSHGQYYYHAHREEEHGHFHLFLRPKGMPDNLKPADVPDFKKPDGDNDALSHLIALSMDPYGMAKGLFTTNRWVTAEYWYKADDVIQMLDRFEIDHANPSWPTNQWVSAMVQLFYPQICQLIIERDEAIVKWRLEHPHVNVFEDRNLEITSEIACNVFDQITAIENELNLRKV